MLIYLKEGGWEGGMERMREGNIDQLSPIYSLGMEPTIFQCTGQNSNQMNNLGFSYFQWDNNHLLGLL